ncbi:response regulator transcription factor [Magnetospirillum fulvum]|uniref:Response regulator n=1 Tax=Magnetospirillum fulvum MGU-K5 TaxID=1316936 RepID=S9SBE9_MAGFU|nr:response regulator transcription factor [Magnetospirillum fulvum]EPY02029.1 response regulator [Magnetospirillum fulvum MGU-K5]
MPRLLLVIADPLLAETVAGHLGRAMAVTRADDPASALAAVVDQDLILVDEAAWSGDEAPCRALRAAGVTLPLVLLATGGAGDPDADLVIAKPLRLSALSARLSDVLSRRAATAGIALGPWRLEYDRRLLTAIADERAVRLTDKEVAILRRLAEAAGAVVSRENLLADVWGYSADLDTHTLETHIYRLRRKIGEGATTIRPACCGPNPAAIVSPLRGNTKLRRSEPIRASPHSPGAAPPGRLAPRHEARGPSGLTNPHEFHSLRVGITQLPGTPAVVEWTKCSAAPG